MRIAVAYDDEYVSEHFGHCEGFALYEAEEGRVVKKGFKQNPGHRPGFLPKYLKEAGVDLIISGGMGEAAQQLFAKNNIEVIVGVEGSCDEVVLKYLDGELKSSGRVCSEHQHRDLCHE